MTGFPYWVQSVLSTEMVAARACHERYETASELESSMARYKKIHVAMYADAKFNALSRPQPNGQSLWVYLLTGPHTTVIPGLSMFGEASAAEALGWPLEGFRKAFAEVFAKGLAKADWGARVLWVPNGIKYNPPQSPNVIKAWAKAWDEIPECALKVVAFTTLKAFAKGLGEAFNKAFAKEIEKLSGTSSSSSTQEQEQEKNPPSPPLRGGSVRVVPEDPQKSPAAPERPARPEGRPLQGGETTAGPASVRAGDESLKSDEPSAAAAVDARPPPPECGPLQGGETTVAPAPVRDDDEPPKGGETTAGPAGARPRDESPKGDALPPPAFARWWKEYPRCERKEGKKTCLRHWKRAGLEKIGDRVIASLRRSKASQQWTKNGGEFIPLPLTFLNKTPWETDPAELVKAGEADRFEPADNGFVGRPPTPEELRFLTGDDDANVRG